MFAVIKRIYKLEMRLVIFCLCLLLLQREQVARELAESEAAKLGQIAQPLRAAVTGSAQSPGLFEVLEVLGRQEVLGRIDDALAG